MGGPPTNALIGRWLTLAERRRLRRLEPELNALPSTPSERFEWMAELHRGLMLLLNDRQLGESSG